MQRNETPALDLNMSTITLPVSEDAAKAYDSLSDTDKLELSEYVKRKLAHKLLLAQLQKTASYAEKNGLTEAELDSILEDVS
jgi:hypothetical protein